MLAAPYRNDVVAARTLIADGADVHVKDETEQSAYLIATSEVGDDPRLLELTLRAGADVGAKGQLRRHQSHPRPNAATAASSVACSPPTPRSTTSIASAGPPSSKAIILGEGGRAQTETVRRLVDAGADVNLADKAGTTRSTTRDDTTTRGSHRSFARRAPGHERSSDRRLRASCWSDHRGRSQLSVRGFCRDERASQSRKRVP